MQIYTRGFSTCVAMSTEQSINLRLQRRQEQDNLSSIRVSSTVGGVARRGRIRDRAELDVLFKALNRGS